MEIKAFNKRREVLLKKMELAKQGKKKVDELYTEGSVLYDAVYGRSYYKRKARQIKETVLTEDKNSFLDIGCGTGELEKEIFRKTEIENVYGVDISPQMAELADELNNGNVCIADASSLPFKKESFESAALIGDVIGYVDLLELCFSEVERILTQDGAVFLTYFKWPAAKITSSMSGRTRAGKSISSTYESTVKDSTEQTAEVTFTFELPNENEVIQKTTLRCYEQSQVEKALLNAGFSDVVLEDSMCTSQVNTVSAFL